MIFLSYLLFENDSNFDDVKEKHGRIFRSTDETVLFKVLFFILFTTKIYQRTAWCLEHVFTRHIFCADKVITIQN